jgi:hypothetical protein
VVFADIQEWSDTTNYGRGDVVVFNSAGPGTPSLFVATEPSVGEAPSVGDPYWKGATDDDIRVFAEGNTANVPIRAVHSDMLISHWAKYGIIFDRLKQINFKDFDNEAALRAVTAMQMYRDKAKIDLLQHKKFDALNDLFEIKLLDTSLGSSTEIVYYNVKFTL